MTPLVGALLGAGIGVGSFVVFRALSRSRLVPLGALGEVLSARGMSASDVDADRDGPGPAALGPFQIWLGRLGARLLGLTGASRSAELGDRLRVLDKSVERHCYEKMLAAVAGFGLPVFGGVTLTAGGVQTPVVAILLVGLLLAVGGFVYPDLHLKEQVEERRRAFRHALSSYLDLVTVLMAGGAGLRSALEGAADAGDGWTFGQLRAALRRAETSRRSVWDTFDELGIELGIDELRVLSSSIALAGESGARIKDSLAAKADAMRASQAAELEADAERQTERMIVPVVVLVFGLVLFIGYGATEAITTGSSPAPQPDAQEPSLGTQAEP